MKRLTFILFIAAIIAIAIPVFPQTVPVITMNSQQGGAGATGASGSGVGGVRQVMICDPTTGLCQFGGNGGGLNTITYSGGNVAVLAADFTDASSTAQQTITGLSITLPANSATNYPFRCELMYAQATAAVADGFGIQAATFNPTRIDAQGWVGTSAAVVALGNLANLNTTTATSIVAFTPSAITTVWNARLSGVIQNAANSSAQVINFTVSQTTAGDLITVKAGSWCAIGF